MAAASAEFNGHPGVEGRNHLSSITQYRNALNRFLAEDETRLKGGRKVPNIKTQRDIDVATDLKKAIEDAQAGNYKGYQDYPSLGSCS